MVVHAVVFFALSLFLVLFSDFQLSVALMVGAIGMVLSGVVRVDEADRAVSWKTVLLMAGLIPLGMAMEVTGTAAWLARKMLIMLGGAPDILMPLALARPPAF